MRSVGEGKLKNLSPLFSFHWQGLAKEEILSGKFNESSPLRLTDDPSDANFFALPMHWSYYLWNGKAKMHEAFQIAGVAEKHGKKLIIWFKGDLVPIIPFRNSILFLPGAVRARLKENYRACPVFIDDPELTYGKAEARFREKSERPLVGFCGYGSISAAKLGWSIAAGLYSNINQRFSRSNFTEIPIIPATVIRNRAMKFLEDHSGIDTRFEIRTKHTANQQQREPTEISRSFYENIYGTDYTLCVRGFGNWSYRFYETLACGRIPIFVDSDCVIPLESTIDWRRYCVWVDRRELSRIGEKVLDFHASLNPSEFVERQMECRKLWLDHLTPKGCSQNIRFYLENAISGTNGSNGN